MAAISNLVRSSLGGCAALMLVATPTLAVDDGFAAFWKGFAAAVAKDDRAALASMTGPVLAPFTELHAHYLGPSDRRCLARGKPVFEVDPGLGPNYSVTCGGTAYVFLQVDGAWKLNDMELDN